MRLGNSDGIRLKMARKIRKKHAKAIVKAGSSKMYPVPILEAKKRHPVPKLEAQKRHHLQRHIPSTPKYGSAHPHPPSLWDTLLLRIMNSGLSL